MAVKKFRFEAISKDGKNLSGFIFSEDQEKARAKLRGEGMAVLAIEVYQEEKKKNPNAKTFEFKAKAPGGNLVRGNIEAEDEYLAYKKLRVEYDFTLVYLIPSEGDLAKKEELKKKGMNPRLEELFDQDESVPESARKKKKALKKDKVSTMLEDRKQEMEFFKEEIKLIIDEIQKLIKENEKFIEPAKKREILENVDRLSRLRQSSSIEHLKSMIDRLLILISQNEIFIEEFKNAAPDNMQALVLKEKFRETAEKLGKQVKEGLGSIQVNTDKFRVVLDLQSPLFKVFTTFYWMFVFLFFMLIAFWTVNTVKLFFGYDIFKTDFYFQSGLLWFVTGFAGIIAFFFSFEVLSSSALSWKQRSVLYGFTSVVFLFFVLEFPVIFYWT